MESIFSLAVLNAMKNWECNSFNQMFFFYAYLYENKIWDWRIARWEQMCNLFGMIFDMDNAISHMTEFSKENQKNRKS